MSTAGNDIAEAPARRALRRALIALALLLLALAYLAGQRTNPPGFFVDESSIALNAMTIAQHGVDEDGAPFPLYFRAFGEYKNPIYIYLLAFVFKLAHPGVLTARRLSALLGFLAALALARLAWQMTNKRWLTIATLATALVTPALFELSRLVFEVAIYPLLLALFLLAAHKAAHAERWPPRLIAALVATLTLLDYAYSIGRLFAPLLLAALWLLVTRARLRALIITSVLFVLTSIVPTVIFNSIHEHALTNRARYLSYMTNGEASTTSARLVMFEQHFLADVAPLRLALRGDPNGRHHVAGGGGSILLMTILLGGAGLVIATLRASRDRWLAFLALATLFSVIPAALTSDDVHMLRLIPLPVMLIVLSIVTLDRIRWRPVIAIAALAGTTQAGIFFNAFIRHGAERKGDFDAGARRVIEETLAQPQRPIYMHGSAYAHALWFGALRGAPRSDFVKLENDEAKAPPHEIVFTAGAPPADVRIISKSGDYVAYVMP